MNEQSDAVVNPVDNRKYIRLSGKLAVDVRSVSIEDQLLVLPKTTGLTQNVSRGGICLELKLANQNVLRHLKEQGIYLELMIKGPFVSQPIRFVSTVVWYNQVQSQDYFVGLKFHSAVEEHVDQLLGRVKFTKRFKKLFSAAIVIIAIFTLYMILS